MTCEHKELCDRCIQMPGWTCLVKLHKELSSLISCRDVAQEQVNQKLAEISKFHDYANRNDRS